MHVMHVINHCMSQNQPVQGYQSNYVQYAKEINWWEKIHENWEMFQKNWEYSDKTGEKHCEKDTKRFFVGTQP